MGATSCRRASPFTAVKPAKGGLLAAMGIPIMTAKYGRYQPSWR